MRVLPESRFFVFCLRQCEEEFSNQNLIPEFYPVLSTLPRQHLLPLWIIFFARLRGLISESIQKQRPKLLIYSNRHQARLKMNLASLNLALTNLAKPELWCN